MAFYQKVQDVSNAMVWVKKLCRDMSPRFCAVQAALDAAGDCPELKAVSQKKKKPCIDHVTLAKYRAKTAAANMLVEQANELMAEVHDGLTAEAKRVGLDDHVYKRNGGGDR